MSALYELITVATVEKDGKRYANTPILWMCLRPEEPDWAYEELIANYDRMDDHHREFARCRLEENFTWEEAELLEHYLATFDGHTVLTPLPLPAEDTYPLGLAKPSENVGFYPLFQDKQYCLPFKVSGFYDIRVGEPVDGE